MAVMISRPVRQRSRDTIYFKLWEVIFLNKTHVTTNEEAKQIKKIYKSNYGLNREEVND
jgi:hypothetical protein